MRALMIHTDSDILDGMGGGEMRLKQDLGKDEV